MIPNSAQILPETGIGEYRHGLSIRAFVAGVLLLFFGFSYAFGPGSEIEGIYGVAGVLVVLLVMNWPLWLIGRRRNFRVADFYVHWGLDIIVATAGIYWLGLLDIPLSAAAYMIIIVSAATFATMRSALLVASIVSCLYTGLVWAESAGMLYHYHVGFSAHLDSRGRLFSVAGAVIMCYAFAFVGGSLATQLRARGREIGRQKQELEVSYARELNARESMVLLATLVQHDVYSPLGVVSGACREAMESCRNGDLEEARHYVAMVARRLRSIESAVESLGVIADRDEEEVAVDGKEIVDQVIEDLETEARERRVQILVGGTWPRIRTRRSHVYHVLRNLISNAIKAVEEDGTGLVSVAGERGLEGGWVIKVSDNGPGLAPKVIQHLQRAVPGPLKQRTEGGGFGAGLLLSRNLAADWGGSLRYEAVQPCGSSFLLQLPRKLLA